MKCGVLPSTGRLVQPQTGESSLAPTPCPGVGVSLNARVKMPTDIAKGFCDFHLEFHFILPMDT